MSPQGFDLPLNQAIWLLPQSAWERDMLVDFARNSLCKRHTFLVFVNIGKYFYFPLLKLKFIPEYLVFICIFYSGILERGHCLYISN